MTGDNRPPPLDYRPPGRDGSIWTRPVRHGGWWLALAIGVILGVFVTEESSRSRSMRAKVHAVQNWSNLKQIGLAVQRSCSDHGGRYPDSLADLVPAGLSMKTLVSPLSSDTPATTPTPSPTTREVAAALAMPGHCSYVYLGRGLTNRTATDKTIIAHDRLADHGGTGCNVLYGDSHVGWLDAKHAATLPTTGPAAMAP